MLQLTYLTALCLRAYFLYDDLITQAEIENITNGLAKLKALRKRMFIKLGGFDVPGAED
jgi:hypothetical protein